MADTRSAMAEKIDALKYQLLGETGSTTKPGVQTMAKKAAKKSTTKKSRSTSAKKTKSKTQKSATRTRAASRATKPKSKSKKNTTKARKKAPKQKARRKSPSAMSKLQKVAGRVLAGAAEGAVTGAVGAMDVTTGEQQHPEFERRETYETPYQRENQD